MAEEIDLPAVGPVKRQWVYIGGALVAGILVYAYWQRARAGGPAAPEYVDPAAGAPVDGPTTPGITHSPPDPVDPDDLPPTTNGEWTRRGVDYMQNLGFDPQLVAGVLGKYLAHQPLTPSETDIVRTVEGVMGKPPVGQVAIIPIPNPPSPPANTGPTGPIYAEVKAGWKVNQWIRDLQRGYGPAPAGAPTLTYDQIAAMNPGMNGNIKWAGGNNEENTFKAAATYRIR